MRRQLMSMARVAIPAVALIIALGATAVHLRAGTRECPSFSNRGIVVHACQIGDSVQLLGENNNDEDARFDVRLRIDLDHGQTTRAMTARLRANRGDQLEIWDFDGDLLAVRSVEISKVVLR